MARSFNGSTDKITLSGPTSFPINTACSVCAWVYLTTTGNAFKTIYDVMGNVGREFILRLGTPPVDTPVFGTWDGGTSHVATAPSALSANQWYAIVGTFDGTNYNLYVTGMVTATNSTGAGASDTQIAVNIGEWNTNNTRGFPGRIADVAVWNVALTALEANAFLSGVRPYQIRPGSLIAYLPLDGLSSPETDLSGNGHNGTLTGTASAFGPPFMPFTPRWPQFTEIAAAPPTSSLIYNYIVSGTITVTEHP